METTLRNVKGTKDFLPQEQGLRNYIRRTLEEVFGPSSRDGSASSSSATWTL